MRTTLLLGLVSLVSLAGAVPADAQVIAPPPRSAPAGDATAPRPRTSSGLLGGRPSADPNSPQTEVTLTVNALGAYDDNLSAGPEGHATNPLAPAQSGTAATLSSELRYSRQQADNSIDASLSTYLNSFRNIDVDTLVGGQADVHASYRIGGRTAVNGSARADYQPTFQVSGLTGVPSDGLPPTVDGTIGFTELSSQAVAAFVGLAEEWNDRHQTNAVLSYSRQTHSLTDINAESKALYVGHRSGMTRNVGVRVAYRRTRQTVDDPIDGTRPLDSHFASIGFDYRLPVSRTRQLQFSGGPAVIRVSTFSSLNNEPFEYVAPSGFGSVRLDLGRTWSVASDWSRQTTVLDGLTQQTFLTNSFGVSLGGGVTSDLTFAASAGYSKGAPHRGDAGSYTGANGTAQLDYRFARWGSLLTSYSYYQHELRDLSRLPAGFPGTFERHTVRVGIQFWLPLYGAFARDPRESGRN